MKSINYAFLLLLSLSGSVVSAQSKEELKKNMKTVTFIKKQRRK